MLRLIFPQRVILSLLGRELNILGGVKNLFTEEQSLPKKKAKRPSVHSEPKKNHMRSFDSGNGSEVSWLHEINIERIKREFKANRITFDFDEKFLDHCFQKQDSIADTSSGDHQQPNQP